MKEQLRTDESSEPLHPLIPDVIENPKEQERQIVKDERDESGNGYVEVLLEAAPMRTQAITHQFKVGYEVTDKSGGTPGKRWQKMNEEDLGQCPTQGRSTR